MLKNYKKIEEKPKLVVPHNPGWIKPLNNKLLDDNFKKIFIFYVINAPCKNASERSFDIKAYWGENVWEAQVLRRTLIKVGDMDEKTTFVRARRLGDISDLFAQTKLNKFPFDTNKNIIAFYNNGKAEFLDVFFYIRCSLAHGRFKIKVIDKEKMYFLETGDNNRKKDGVNVKARMIIKEKTLLDWIEIITNGYKTQVK